jgi:hypothetical protein
MKSETAESLLCLSKKEKIPKAYAVTRRVHIFAIP